MTKNYLSLSEKSSINSNMFNENVKLTRTKTAQTCLGKKKIQKEQFQAKLLVWVFSVSCPGWRAGTALRQVSGVATRSHRTLAANSFVKPSSNAATEPAADLPLASLVSESTLSNTLRFQNFLISYVFSFSIQTLGRIPAKCACESLPSLGFPAVLDGDSRRCFSRDCKPRLSTQSLHHRSCSQNRK